MTQDLFKTLYDKGYVIKQTALGAFSASTGRTLPDRYIEGTCPICGYGEARGDQCDNCGNQLDPADLINPRSKIDGTPPVFKETEHFFLDLSAFAERLSEWIAQQDALAAECARLLAEPAGGAAPARDHARPGLGRADPAAEYADRDDKRIYVWFDAVIGYLSASVEWAHNRGTPEAWREWWQNPDARHYYFMGKDNIVFHSVIWPSMLMGYGNGGAIGGNGDSPLNLPYDVVSSEFLTMEGKKFSSSRGIVIYVNDVLSRYDPDPLRYFLTIGGPETQDTDFTWAEFVRRNNDELVATWGNLVNRTLTNAHRNFGEVPQPGALEPSRSGAARRGRGWLRAVGALLETARFKAALGEVMQLAARSTST